MTGGISGLDGVYVIHCKKGYEARARSIERQLGALGLPFEYVLDFDADEIPSEQRRRFGPHLSPGACSVILKHFRAMELAANRGLRRCLILEDDVILGRAFGPRLGETLVESLRLGENHTVFLSNACHMYTPRSRMRKGQLLYEHPASRAADSYLVTLSACEKRLAWFGNRTIDVPIDHLFNKMDPELGLLFLWLGEPIVEQGSENGRFASWVEGNPPPLVTRLKWNAEKFYKKHILRNLT